MCDWTDKKNYLVQYRILKFYVGHDMVVDKMHATIPFEQSKCLEKNIIFNTQKRNKAKNDLRKTSTNYLITQFMEKQWK